MNRGRADSQGSLEPNDEVMPYSDDETDDELDASSEEEVEVFPGAPGAPGAPEAVVDTRPSGEFLKAIYFPDGVLLSYFDLKSKVLSKVQSKHYQFVTSVLKFLL